MKTLKYLSLLVTIIGITLVVGCNKAASCEDGIQNQGERGIDCSGPCTNEGKVCNCYNGVKDGEETDVDCGGQYCKCCDPPCEPVVAPTTCVDPAGATAVFQIDEGPSLSKRVSGTIDNDGNLRIIIQNSDEEGFLQINQTVSGFAADEYEIKNSGISIITISRVNGKSYSSQATGSEGKLIFTEFKNDIGCKYVSGTFSVVLFNLTNKDESILLSGSFNEVPF